jgi:hypothetical protein
VPVLRATRRCVACVAAIDNYKVSRNLTKVATTCRLCHKVFCMRHLLLTCMTCNRVCKPGQQPHQADQLRQAAPPSQQNLEQVLLHAADLRKKQRLQLLQSSMTSPPQAISPQQQPSSIRFFCFFFISLHLRFV